ncbi:MAG: hypothetical protein FJ095_18505 [Deltaproteobacteria bacterium]|nr:hypothetical protein [Deltaproteobacteria bacterium]
MGKTLDQALWYPSSMLEEMHALAGSQKKTTAWVVEQAWGAARAEIAKLDGHKPWRAEKVFEQRYADADKVKHVLTLSVTTMDEIKSEAARLDRSMSWLVARCFCIAHETLGQPKSATTGA